MSNTTNVDKSQYVQAICDATGWDYKTAEQKLNAAKKIGTPWGRYVKKTVLEYVFR